jgi:hypothetical protein
MNCQRALEALSSLATHQPAFTADEIEELLALGLALEADPRDLATLGWLVPAVQDHAGSVIDDPEVPLTLGMKLGEAEEQLKSDWYRFTTSKDKIAAREQDRRAMRRAVSVLSDARERERLLALVTQGRNNGDPTYAACAALGSERYAISVKGTRVGRELQVRIDRFAGQPLGAFLKAFEKSEAKMAAFSGDIATLAGRIGPVKKNAHQVVIGLAKTGVPPAQALELYHHSMRSAGTPDVAVTLARNAATHGSPEDVAHRLTQAQHALRQAGVTMSEVAMGAAKSLLPFEPLETGAARFTEIAQLLEAQNLTRGDGTLKSAARLMPATGTPGDVVRRALLAYNQLPDGRDRDAHTASAVALASLVRDDDAIAPVVARFLALHDELTRRRVSLPAFAAADALECVSCPGTPAEVVETVRALVAKLARGRESRRDDVAVAVAFAKRFAY